MDETRVCSQTNLEFKNEKRKSLAKNRLIDKRERKVYKTLYLHIWIKNILSKCIKIFKFLCFSWVFFVKCYIHGEEFIFFSYLKFFLVFPTNSYCFVLLDHGTEF